MNSAALGRWYVTPAMAFIFAVLVAPSFYGVYYSMFDLSGGGFGEFVGFENYTYLIDDFYLYESIFNTVIFATSAVTLTLVLALALALWVNTLSGPIAIFVQILIILPWVLSNVVGALLFRWVFVNEGGVGAYWLEQLGVSSFRPLSDPVVAMVVLVVFACWRTIGFAFILLLAGLKSIPADYYEAATVDGASAWQRLFNITLPLLTTPLLISLVVLTLSNLNNVETPLIVTGGGPAGATNIIPLELYSRAFTRFDFNSAVSLGVVMFVFNIVLSVFYVRMISKNG